MPMMRSGAAYSYVPGDIHATVCDRKRPVAVSHRPRPGSSDRHLDQGFLDDGRAASLKCE